MLRDKLHTQKKPNENTRVILVLKVNITFQRKKKKQTQRHYTFKMNSMVEYPGVADYNNHVIYLEMHKRPSLATIKT